MNCWIWRQCCYFFYATFICFSEMHWRIKITHFTWHLKRWFRKQSLTTVDISVKSFKCPQMRLKIHMHQKLCRPRKCLHRVWNPAEFFLQMCLLVLLNYRYCLQSRQPITHQYRYMRISYKEKKRRMNTLLMFFSCFHSLQTYLGYINIVLFCYILLFIYLLMFCNVISRKWIPEMTLNFLFQMLARLCNPKPPKIIYKVKSIFYLREILLGIGNIITEANKIWTKKSKGNKWQY